MSDQAERVLVIQDTSRALRTDAIKSTLHALSLKPGDKIKLLGVIDHHISTPKTFSIFCCGLLLAYKAKLHTSATISSKLETIEKDCTKKLEEYQNHTEIKELLKLPEMQQIEFDMTVEAGNSLKEVAIQAASNFDATYVFLDKHMKKDRRYFMDNLSCGILRMKQDGSVEHLREPKAAEIQKMPTAVDQSSHVDFANSRREEQEGLFGTSICSLCMNVRPRVGHFREFTYAELQFATNGFSPQNLLPSHGKKTYRGVLSGGENIVVKKHTSGTIKELQFQTQVLLLGKMARHDNLAMLLGSCSEGLNRLLIYEYVCNGSLNWHLSSKNHAKIL
ncbi:unnamed protein product [Ilex paraguariensis]|uniref:non-specific serine/threonine protein kinase n=1 Tax=Ilex paraguariensis TaxID=185542 RepID=A0ABC8TLS6_9AQUA